MYNLKNVVHFRLNQVIDNDELTLCAQKFQSFCDAYHITTLALGLRCTTHRCNGLKLSITLPLLCCARVKGHTAPCKQTLIVCADADAMRLLCFS